MDIEVARVVIGMDPHKRSVTIEVMTDDESVVGGGRFSTDADGYARLLVYARSWPQRVWAVEGCAGIGKHVADRLVAYGEQVVDVPAKMSARVRIFATGQGRKTDATDAHSIAPVNPSSVPAPDTQAPRRSWGRHPRYIHRLSDPADRSVRAALRLPSQEVSFHSPDPRWRWQEPWGPR